MIEFIVTVIGLLFYSLTSALIIFLSFIFASIVNVVVHECGHAIAAIMLGGRVSCIALFANPRKTNDYKTLIDRPAFRLLVGTTLDGSVRVHLFPRKAPIRCAIICAAGCGANLASLWLYTLLYHSDICWGIEQISIGLAANCAFFLLGACMMEKRSDFWFIAGIVRKYIAKKN